MTRHLTSGEHLKFLETGEKYIPIEGGWESHVHDKIECECGGKYVKMHTSTHAKTKRHMDFVTKGTLKKTNSISCECGGTYTVYNKNPHLKTKKHLAYLAGR